MNFRKTLESIALAAVTAAAAGCAVNGKDSTPTSIQPPSHDTTNFQVTSSLPDTVRGLDADALDIRATSNKNIVLTGPGGTSFSLGTDAKYTLILQHGTNGYALISGEKTRPFVTVASTPSNFDAVILSAFVTENAPRQAPLIIPGPAGFDSAYAQVGSERRRLVPGENRFTVPVDSDATKHPAIPVEFTGYQRGLNSTRTTRRTTSVEARAATVAQLVPIMNELFPGHPGRVVHVLDRTSATYPSNNMLALLRGQDGTSFPGDTASYLTTPPLAHGAAMLADTLRILDTKTLRPAVYVRPIRVNPMLPAAACSYDPVTHAFLVWPVHQYMKDSNGMIDSTDFFTRYPGKVVTRLESPDTTFTIVNNDTTRATKAYVTRINRKTTGPQQGTCTAITTYPQNPAKKDSASVRFSYQ